MWGKVIESKALTIRTSHLVSRRTTMLQFPSDLLDVSPQQAKHKILLCRPSIRLQDVPLRTLAPRSSILNHWCVVSHVPPSPTVRRHGRRNDLPVAEVATLQFSPELWRVLRRSRVIHFPAAAEWHTACLFLKPGWLAMPGLLLTAFCPTNDPIWRLPAARSTTLHSLHLGKSPAAMLRFR